MVVFNQVNFNLRNFRTPTLQKKKLYQIGLSEPVDLLGGLEVFIVFLQFGLQEKSITLGFNAGNDGVTPLHESDLFANLQSVGILIFKIEFISSVKSSSSQSSVLGVNGDFERLGFSSVVTASQLKSTDLLGGDSSVSSSNRVNMLLIQSPNLEIEGLDYDYSKNLIIPYPIVEDWCS